MPLPRGQRRSRSKSGRSVLEFYRALPMIFLSDDLCMIRADLEGQPSPHRGIQQTAMGDSDAGFSAYLGYKTDTVNIIPKQVVQGSSLSAMRHMPQRCPSSRHCRCRQRYRRIGPHGVNTGLSRNTVDDINPIRTLNYGNYGILLLMGNAGVIIIINCSS